MRYLISCIVLLAMFVPVTKALGDPNDAVYLDFSGIEGRGDLNDTEKTALKTKIESDILKNVNRGKDRIRIVKEKKDAKRTITFKDSTGTYNDATGQHSAWGTWEHGSDNVNVYIKEWLDDPAVSDAFKTGGKWDPTKLGNGMGAISAHELTHSYSGGHKDPPRDKNKMNPSFYKELATTEYGLDDDSLKTMDENLGKNPCKPEPKKPEPDKPAPKAIKADYERDAYVDPTGQSKYSDPYAIDISFAFSGSKANLFNFGWLGADSDGGALDGDSSNDFIYKACMDGSFDSLITMFDGWTASFSLQGIGGGPWITMDSADVQLSDYITNWKGVEVARHLTLSWNVDENPGADVTVDLDTRTYGNVTITNGFEVVPEPSTLILIIGGGFALLRKRSA